MKNSPFTARLTFALHGLQAALLREKSFRTQTIIAVAACGFLGVLQPDLIWWALVGAMIALVLGAELINTALETLTDHLHPEKHPEIKVVKDCAAAAVLVLSIGAVWVGILAAFSVF